MGHLDDASERLHQALLEHVSLNLQPGIRASLVEAVLQDHVTSKHAEARYRKGKQEIQAKLDAFPDLVEALEDARQLIGQALAWSGDEGWRNEATARIDALIVKFAPEVQS